MAKSTKTTTKKSTAKKAATKKVAAPKAPKTPKAPRVEQNGIVQPKEGTKTRQVWDIADKLSAKGQTATRADVIEAGTKAGLDAGTVATQYGYWRLFHGLKGRLSSPKAPKTPAKKATTKKSTTKKAAKKRAPKAPAAPVPPPAPTA